MSATELKDILHKQIDSLQDPEDIQDLFLTVSEFIGQRNLYERETTEFIQKLQHTLNSTKSGSFTSHENVVKEAKQWLTK